MAELIAAGGDGEGHIPKRHPLESHAGRLLVQRAADIAQLIAGAELEGFDVREYGGMLGRLHRNILIRDCFGRAGVVREGLPLGAAQLIRSISAAGISSLSSVPAAVSKRTMHILINRTIHMPNNN